MLVLLSSFCGLGSHKVVSDVLKLLCKQGDYAMRRRMADMYDNIARVAFGSDEAAAEAGYVPANVETVVQVWVPSQI